MPLAWGLDCFIRKWKRRLLSMTKVRGNAACILSKTLWDHHRDEFVQDDILFILFLSQDRFGQIQCYWWRSVRHCVIGRTCRWITRCVWAVSSHVRREGIICGPSCQSFRSPGASMYHILDCVITRMVRRRLISRSFHLRVAAACGVRMGVICLHLAGSAFVRVSFS